jgi:DivIVA domain-containing protein
VTWLFTLLAMTVIAVVAGVVTGRIGGGGMDAPASSLPFRGLPPEDVAPADLETLRFSPALRGYRMDEVDQVLDRLGSELRRRDDEIAALRDRLAGAPDPGDQHELGEPEPADVEPGGRQLPGRS